MHGAFGESAGPGVFVLKSARHGRCQPGRQRAVHSGKQTRTLHPIILVGNTTCYAAAQTIAYGLLPVTLKTGKSRR